MPNCSIRINIYAKEVPIYCPVVLLVSLFMKRSTFIIAQLFYSYQYLCKRSTCLFPSSPTRISIYAKEVSFFLYCPPVLFVSIFMHKKYLLFFLFFFYCPEFELLRANQYRFASDKHRVAPDVFYTFATHAGFVHEMID